MTVGVDVCEDFQLLCVMCGFRRLSLWSEQVLKDPFRQAHELWVHPRLPSLALKPIDSQTPPHVAVRDLLAQIHWPKIFFLQHDSGIADESVTLVSQEHVRRAKLTLMASSYHQACVFFG